MTAFQAKGAARLSPLLLRILEDIEPEQSHAGTALAVAELSRLFTKEREALGMAYLDDPSLARAYLRYFFPVNLSKIQVLLDELPEETRRSIGEALDATARGDRLILNVAFNYAGRTELVDAVRRLVAAGTTPGAIDESTIGAALYTAGLPDPDLLIRTGGEQRISNFLLWQLAYTELYFTETLWPDFDGAALDQAIASYRKRERRFGRTSEQLEQSQRPEVA